jgi:hypothetical protein
MNNFSLKFIDVMIGMVLGLGFQWWPELHEPWQYIAFIFAYIDVVDYWIDYGPSLKKFPPKYSRDVFLDIAIMFTLFLYIFSTQHTIQYFLISFISWRVLDTLWLVSSRAEYHPKKGDKLSVDTWIRMDLLESVLSIILLIVAVVVPLSSLIALLLFIVYRVSIRFIASSKYNMVYFK